MSRRKTRPLQTEGRQEDVIEAKESGPTRFPWPPVIALIAGVSAYLLGLLFTPLSLLPPSYAPVLKAFGWLLIGGGIALDTLAMITLRRGKTTVSPIHSSARLVTNGPYAISRNPIYLGNTLILIGLGFALNNFWFPLLAVIAAYAVTKLQIVPEEKHLAARFGKGWRQYSKRVSRWF
ncbi:isoprenylcysteine carboxylmethyltransferase family protein [Notoacmeibacter sp. MSK16QG-6]|uniref:methyltransferase family protein n=1 Tax=Notoacmeibacter sp. MSK16QG-6 TaxID=2957982 RepID=UPI0020A0D7D3|nr:isoprenylcysteine carboxylmethyltransferase family protein [Notoacmeibacter sp. MSK16QG-6]MCP1199319.1 isoprenylcysteine carboxylmethyltransferase family protein [Notoacmeibacter sp. MSK16QG-6]